ncbi:MULTISPECIES: NAD-dependent epimerase/dehydratase family protein [Nitrosomonas]|uniref:NAD-dependent epimerase n=1 Tax=Nitrosomonas communis TaxID=44574 RepID=A0A0F7KIM4_9PROT|nr:MULTISPECIES: NAD(P)-dependent oxidoreductase [Nitrosomonas]AKH38953.1 NAD-dependent epimerase [Nitrosomonas communis]TYP82096.1 UDP-glucose 4-epimerase [Nitrosomonas communis]UVS61102.1 NAD(P)-dependent oxidoreductase [Nitrosomonas sp. PLL12]SDV99389.1 UDP-glucose 4-epimerase [Nitrosomonas communis]
MENKLASDEIAVVFGASGFLGSHVADALSEAGYRVRLFDRSPSPYQRPDQEMIVGDLMDIEQVIEAAKGAAAVYNFAAIADIDEAHDKPLATATINVLGNMHVLEAARSVGARRFIFASSVYVYSESGSFYRASKQAAERFTETYHERYGLEYTILRYGSLYGRRSDLRNGIYRMLHEAVQKHTITYHGSGNAMREYIHVEDAARMSVQVLAPEFANRHLILTGQEKLRIRDVMTMISEIMPWSVQLHFEEANAVHHYEITPYAFQPRIGRKLVLNEHVDLGQGLLDCLREIHQHIHHANEDDDATPSTSDNKA